MWGIRLLLAVEYEPLIKLQPPEFYAVQSVWNMRKVDEQSWPRVFFFFLYIIKRNFRQQNVRFSTERGDIWYYIQMCHNNIICIRKSFKRLHSANILSFFLCCSLFIFSRCNSADDNVTYRWRLASEGEKRSATPKYCIEKKKKKKSYSQRK